MSVRVSIKSFIGWKILKEDEIFEFITEEFAEERNLDISFDCYSGKYVYLGFQLSNIREEDDDEESSFDLSSLSTRFKLLNKEKNKIKKAFNFDLGESELFIFQYWY